MKGGGNMPKLNITEDRIRHCIYGDCRVLIYNKNLTKVKTTTLKNRLNKEIDLAAGLNAQHVKIEKTGNHFKIDWYPASLQESNAVMIILSNLSNFDGGVTYKNLKGRDWCFTYSGAHHTAIRSIYDANGGIKETDLKGTVAVPSPDDLSTLLNNLSGKDLGTNITVLGKIWQCKHVEKNDVYHIICNTTNKTTVWNIGGRGDNILCPKGDDIDMA